MWAWPGCLARDEAGGGRPTPRRWELERGAEEVGRGGEAWEDPGWYRGPVFHRSSSVEAARMRPERDSAKRPAQMV